MKIKLFKAPFLVLTIALAIGLPLSAMGQTRTAPIKPKRPATTNLSPSMRKSQQLLKEGQAKTAAEETLGTDPRKRNQAPTGEGTTPDEKSLAPSKGSSAAGQMKVISPARSFTINSDNYFKTSLKTPARNQIFQYQGIKNLDVKAVTISAEDQKSLKVNRNILLARRSRSRMKTGKGQSSSGKTEQTEPAPKPDVAITKIEWLNDNNQIENLVSINKSSKGKWLKFRVYVANQANDRDAVAYRIDITAEHMYGREWPTTDAHIPRLLSKNINVVVIEVFVPQNALVKPGHQIRFFADKEQVNEDLNGANNFTKQIFEILPPIEPDLYIKRFARKRTDSKKDWGPISRGWIQYQYDIEVGNKGNIVSPPTDLTFKVQKVDHRHDHPAPILCNDWYYQIPSLGKCASHGFSTSRFKVYVEQTCQVNGVIDPENRIIEPDKDNNHGEGNFQVSVRNPFAGTFLGGLWKEGYNVTMKVGNAVFDGLSWVYNGLVAASQYALAAVITPEMMAWVEVSHGIHEGQGRPLNAAEKEMLAPMFPQHHINKARIHIVNSWARPELWGDGAGVTFKNAIVVQKGKLSNSLLVHEMVHSYQYSKLGVPKFCWNYIYSWVKTNFTYRKINLEVQAYGFEAQYSTGKIERIEDYLGY
jgi:hypothetical protein